MHTYYRVFLTQEAWHFSQYNSIWVGGIKGNIGIRNSFCIINSTCQCLPAAWDVSKGTTLLFLLLRWCWFISVIGCIRATATGVYMVLCPVVPPRCQRINDEKAQGYRTEWHWAWFLQNSMVIWEWQIKKPIQDVVLIVMGTEPNSITASHHYPFEGPSKSLSKQNCVWFADS